MSRFAMIIDLERCYGCDACKAACQEEHMTPPAARFAEVLRAARPGTGWEDETAEGRVFLPLLCMQCEAPACMAACGDGAIRVAEGGIVVIDEDRCTGCGQCVAACPYHAVKAASPHTVSGDGGFLKDRERDLLEAWHRRFQKGIPSKCDFCSHRISEGKVPRCVAVCPVGAHVFGDLDDASSDVESVVDKGEAGPIFSERGTRPRVFYRPPKGTSLSDIERIFKRRA